MIQNAKAVEISIRAGRPRLEEIEGRHQLILEAAGEMFLRLGFDGTTMDAVAEAARISKRTLYARYPDKAVLFNAVLRDLIRRWLTPIEQVQSKHGRLRETLLELAHYLTTFSLTPQCISINRIIISEAQRRPEFGQLANEAGRKPAISAIVSILRKHNAELRSANLEMAAEQFMSLAVDNNLRLAYLGIITSPNQIEQWVQSSVELFLKGMLKPSRSHQQPKK